MKWHMLDLSVPLEPSVSEPEPVSIEMVDHRAGALLLMAGSGLDADSFPDGLGLSLERVRLTSHSGTHVDAPLHYGPKSEGKKARSIDQLPLEWFFGPALVLNCSVGKGTVQREEIKQALAHQKLVLATGDIVFLNTGSDRLWGMPEYFTSFRGCSLEATHYLLDHGVKVIGIDSFGFDAPFHQMLQSYRETSDRRALWPCHVLGREREYCQIERLANLGTLPEQEKFLVSCFPVKLKGCGAGPARVVALLRKQDD